MTNDEFEYLVRRVREDIQELKEKPNKGWIYVYMDETHYLSLRVDVSLRTRKRGWDTPDREVKL